MDDSFIDLVADAGVRGNDAPVQQISESSLDDSFVDRVAEMGASPGADDAGNYAAWYASKHSPDQYAADLKLAAETGVPFDVVQRRRQEAAQIATQQNIANATNPYVKNALTNPDIAAVSHDDVGGLESIANAWNGYQRFVDETVSGKTLDTTIKSAVSGFDQGRLQVERGKLGMDKALNGGVGNDERIAEIDNILKAQEEPGFFGSAGQYIGQMSETIPLGLAAASIGAGGMGIAGVAAGPLAPAAIPTMAMVGAGWGFGTAVMASSWQQEGGNAYLDLTQAGVPHKQALAISQGIGVINGALEVGGVHILTAPAKAYIKKVITEKAVQEAAALTTGAVIKGGLIGYGKTIAGEVGVEVAQEMTQVLGEQIAAWYPQGMSDKDVATAQFHQDQDQRATKIEKLNSKEALDHLADRLWNVSKQTAMGMSLLALPGGAMNVRYDLNKTKEAEMRKGYVDTIKRSIDNSKIITRSPELAEEFLTHLPSDIENVYIPAREAQILFQSAGLNLEEAADKAAIESAITSGGDISIPVRRFAAKYSQVPGILDLVKFAPEDSTPKEAAAYSKEKGEAVSAHVEESAKLFTQQMEHEAQARKLGETFSAELMASGKYGKTTAEQYGHVVSAFYSTLSKDYGVTPYEAFKMVPLSGMKGLWETQQAGELNQAEYMAAKAKGLDMSHDARMQRAKEMGFDTETAVYHGTNQDVLEFKKEHLGSSTKARSAEKAFFFSDNPASADEFARAAGRTTKHNKEYIEKRVKEIIKEQQAAVKNKDWDAYERLGFEWEELELGDSAMDPNLGLNIMPVYLKMKNPFVYDFAGEFASAGLINDKIDQAKTAGHDGVILKNIEDSAEGIVSNHYAVFSPDQIRSVNAAFDPEFSAESNVLFQGNRLRSGKETLKKYGLKPLPGKKKYTTRQVAAALEARTREKFGTIPVNDRSPEAVQKIARWMAAEYEFEAETAGENSGVGWYSEKYQRALDSFGEIFPELKTDKVARNTLTAIIAITSNGNDPLSNARMALDIYNRYRLGGENEGQLILGRSSARNKLISEGLSSLQRLFEKNGAEDTHDFLMQSATVEDLSKLYGIPLTDLTKDYQRNQYLPFAAVALTPKVGVFYANLMGAHDYLTMDRWFSRTFNRYRGTLLTSATQSGINTVRKLIGDESLSDDQVLAATVDIVKPLAKRGFKDMTTLETAANTVYKAWTGTADVPMGAPERSFMIESAKRAVKVLQRKGYTVTVADLQAALWYYEKKLYGDLGAKPSKTDDFLDAAGQLLSEYRGQGSSVFDAPTSRKGNGRLAKVASGEEEFNTEEVATSQTLYQSPNRNAAGLYSAVEKFVLNSSLWKKDRESTVPGDRAWAEILKAPGIKKEELDWVGLKDYLDVMGHVSRQNVIDYLNGNAVKINVETSADRWGDYVYTTPGINYQNIKITLPFEYGDFYWEEHFPDRNILAFLRVNEVKIGGDIQSSEAASYNLRVSAMKIIDRLVKEAEAAASADKYYEAISEHDIYKYINEYNSNPDLKIENKYSYLITNDKIYRIFVNAAKVINQANQAEVRGSGQVVYVVQEMQSDWQQQSRILGTRETMRSLKENIAERAKAFALKDSKIPKLIMEQYKKDYFGSVVPDVLTKENIGIWVEKTNLGAKKGNDYRTAIALAVDKEIDKLSSRIEIDALKKEYDDSFDRQAVNYGNINKENEEKALELWDKIERENGVYENQQLSLYKSYLEWSEYDKHSGQDSYSVNGIVRDIGNERSKQYLEDNYGNLYDYYKSSPEVEYEFNDLVDKHLQLVKLEDQLQKIEESPQIQRAPFKGDAWQSLALKIALKRSVDSGFSRFAWPTSKVISARWKNAKPSAHQAYKNQYDGNMREIVKKLTGVAATIEKDRDGNEFWVIPLSEELKSEIRDKGFSLFQRKDDGPLAAVNFDLFPAGPAVMSFFEKADLTSPVHELGHFFFEAMLQLSKDPSAPMHIQRDVRALAKWAGVKDFEAWRELTPKEREAEHEKIADAFLKYMEEGKAPSDDLHSVFSTLRRFILGVYKWLKTSNPTKISDEVRTAFDRMLATQEAIDSKVGEYKPMFTSAAEAGMSESEFKDYQATAETSVQEAMDIAQQQVMRDINRVLRADKKAISEEVSKEVWDRPAYRVWHFLKTGLLYQRDDLPPGLVASKLSKQDLIDTYGSDADAVWRKLPRWMIVDDTAQAKADYSDPKTVNPKKDSLLVAITKLGGLNREEAAAVGVDPEHFDEYRFGQKYTRVKSGKNLTFPKDGGRSFDDMAETLSGWGYMPEKDLNVQGENLLADLIDQELKGQPVYTTQAAAHIVKTAEAQRRIDEALEAEELPPGEQLEADQYSDEAGQFTDLESRLLELSHRLNALSPGAGNEILGRDLSAVETITLLERGINEHRDTASAEEIAAFGAPKVAEGGNAITADELAEWFQFRNGDELVNTLAEAEKPDGVIKSLAKQRIEDRYGDLTKPGATEALASDAVARSSIAKQIALELKYSSQLAGYQAMPAQQLREIAKRQLGNLKLKDIKPKAFFAQMLKAAKLAEAAMRKVRGIFRAEALGRKKSVTDYENVKGNAGIAARHKQDQLISQYLYQYSLEAEKEIKAIKKYFKQFEKADAFKKIEGMYVEQIRAILSAYRWNPPGSQVAMAAAADYAKFIQEMELQMLPFIGDEQVFNLAANANAELQRTGVFIDKMDAYYALQNLTLDELRGLRSTIENIAYLGSTDLKLVTDRQKRTLADVAASVAKAVFENLKQSGKFATSKNLIEATEEFGKEYSAIFLRPDTLIGEIDGVENGRFVQFGPAFEALKAPVDRAVRSDLIRLQKQFGDRLAEIYNAHYTKAQRAKLEKRMNYVPGLNLTKGDLLSIALHLGNDGNRTALFETEIRGVRFDFNTVKNLIDNHLDRNDLAFVQAIWDLFDNEMWPLVEAKQRERTGTAPAKVQAVPVVTKHGILRGGYFPIKFDSGEDLTVAERDDNQTLKDLAMGRASKAQTANGHTQERVGSGGHPLRLGLHTIDSHISQVVYDLALGDAIRNVWRVLSHKDVRAAFVKQGQLWRYTQLDLWIKDIAASALAPANMVERFITHVRVGYTVTKLGWNLGSMPAQLFGLAQSIEQIGARHVWTGLRMLSKAQAWYGENSVFKQVQDQSNFMLERSGKFLMEIRGIKAEIQNSMWPDWLTSSFFAGISAFQKLVDTITWLGAYAKAKELDGGSWPHEKMVEYADLMVARSQSSALFTDKSAFERGTTSSRTRQSAWIRDLGVLQSFMLVKANLMYETTKATSFKNPANVLRYTNDILLILAYDSIAMALLHGQWPDDEDGDGPGEEFLGMAATETALSFFGMFPVVKDVVNAYRGFTAGGAMSGFASETAKGLHQIWQGDFDESALKAVNNVSGVLFHYPSSQLNRTFGALYEDTQGADHTILEHFIWMQGHK